MHPDIERRGHPRQNRGLDVALYVLGSLGVLLSAWVVGFLGGFLSYAGSDGRHRPLFGAIMTTAVAGPYVLAIIAILIGGYRLGKQKVGSVYPLLGIPATWLLFWICAMAMDL